MGDGGAATGGGVIVVEMIAVELIAGIGRWARIGTRWGVHAQKTAKDRIDVCWSTHTGINTAWRCRIKIKWEQTKKLIVGR